MSLFFKCIVGETKILTRTILTLSCFICECEIKIMQVSLFVFVKFVDQFVVILYEIWQEQKRPKQNKCQALHLSLLPLYEAIFLTSSGQWPCIRFRG